MSDPAHPKVTSPPSDLFRRLTILSGTPSLCSFPAAKILHCKSLFGCGVLATLVLLAIGEAAAAPKPERPPVRVDVAIDRRACTAWEKGAAISLHSDVALGLVAFNSPYLFGGRALHDDLTCGACHNPSGPSGAASRLTFRKAVPDLRHASEIGVDIAAFATHAVVSEFAGPPASEKVTRSLAALAAVMDMEPSWKAGDGQCPIAAAALVDVALRLLIERLEHPGSEDVDLIVDSTRFVLGEMTRTPNSDTIPRPLIDDANRVLHDLSAILDAKRESDALRSARELAERWEGGLKARGLLPFVIEGGIIR